MVVQIGTGRTISALTLSSAEREQLPVAPEYTIASRRGELERALLLCDLEAEQLESRPAATPRDPPRPATSHRSAPGRLAER